MDFSLVTRFADPTGRCSNPRMINAVAALCGVALASDAEIEAGRQLAEAKIGDGVAAISTLRAVQEITGSSVFVVRKGANVTGLTAFFLLRESGMRALEALRFDTATVDLDHVCRPHEPPAGGYAWGFVADNEFAAGLVVNASVMVRETLFWNLPGYARAATDDGARVVFRRLGFKRVPGDATLARQEARSAPFEGWPVRAPAAA